MYHRNCCDSMIKAYIDLFSHELSALRRSTGKEASGHYKCHYFPFHLSIYSSFFIFSVANFSHKPIPRRPFWCPLAAILDFVTGAVLQAVSGAATHLLTYSIARLLTWWGGWWVGGEKLGLRFNSAQLSLAIILQRKKHFSIQGTSSTWIENFLCLGIQGFVWHFDHLVWT